MRQLSVLVIAILAATAVAGAKWNLEIASYNIQRLSSTKCARDYVVAQIVSVLLRWDVVAIQELNDNPKLKCLERIVYGMNFLAPPGHLYQGVRSDKYGSKRHKEQYAFIFRADKLQLVETAQLAASSTEERKGEQKSSPVEVWSRPPFAALFTVPAASAPGDAKEQKAETQEADTKNIFFVNIHVVSKNSGKIAEEIRNLWDAYLAFSSRWNTPNGIILGDFNGRKEMLKSGDNIGRATIEHSDVPLATWPIPDGARTMVVSDKTHDRFVLMGPWLYHLHQPSRGLTGMFRYPYGGEVSDHYPIQMRLSWDSDDPTAWNIPFQAKDFAVWLAGERKSNLAFTAEKFSKGILTATEDEKAGVREALKALRPRNFAKKHLPWRAPNLHRVPGFGPAPSIAAASVSSEDGKDASGTSAAPAEPLAYLTGSDTSASGTKRKAEEGARDGDDESTGSGSGAATSEPQRGKAKRGRSARFALDRLLVPRRQLN